MGVLPSLEVHSDICFLSVTRLHDCDIFAVRLSICYLAILNCVFYFAIAVFKIKRPEFSFELAGESCNHASSPISWYEISNTLPSLSESE